MKYKQGGLFRHEIAHHTGERFHHSQTQHLERRFDSGDVARIVDCESGPRQGPYWSLARSDTDGREHILGLAHSCSLYSIDVHGQKAMRCAAESQLCVLGEAGKRGLLHVVPGRIVLDGLG